MKNLWPAEVHSIFAKAAGSFIIDPCHAEKLKAHINRLWLADTQEETIIYEISVIAEYVGGE